MEVPLPDLPALVGAEPLPASVSRRVKSSGVPSPEDTGLYNTDKQLQAALRQSLKGSVVAKELQDALVARMMDAKT